jgi:hypothetical protein
MRIRIARDTLHVRMKMVFQRHIPASERQEPNADVAD